MDHELPADTDEPLDDRLEALHDALLDNRATPSGAADGRLAGAEQCLKLLERVRKQSSPRDSDWLFGAGDFAARPAPAVDLPLASQLIDGDESPMPRTIGRFSIERRIGEGGFGVVFLAVDPALGRRVALKLPRPETIVSSTWRERFLREAEAAALLDHPGIVPVYEVGRAGSLCFIVQAWCDGLSLAAWLAATSRPVSPLAAAQLVQSLAEAVQHAHSRGVLHRDIKPSNILLETPAGSSSADSLVPPRPAVDTVVVHSGPTVRVDRSIAARRAANGSSNAAAPRITDDELAAVARLADFGLARLVDRGAGQTQSGAVVGTPSYMSPEQAEGLTRQIGVTADVYSLGAVLFELLTGRPPFQEETLLATLQAVREREPPRPRQLNREIPLDLEAICCKCLEKDPRRRYATAQALADDLSRFLHGESITARRAGPLERLGRWCRRKPLLASLSVATVLLAVMLLLGSTAATLLLSQERQKTLDHLQDAIVARDEATRNEDLALAALYEARVAQVQAQRRSGQVGQRLGSLDAAAAAARLLPRLKRGESDMLRLRNEVVACLSLVDLAADKDWSDSVAPGRAVTTDNSATHFVHGDSQWRFLLVRRMEDGQVVQRLEIADNCAQVFKITISPSDQFLAAWCRLRGGRFSVQVWQLDPAEGSEQSEAGARPPLARLRVMAGGEQWPFAFSPDNQWLAIAQADGSVALFSLPECKQEKSLRGKDAIDALCFDPASRNLAVARRGRIELIAAESGKHLQSLTTGSFTYHLAFSPDGALLAAGATDKRVRLWNVSDGTPFGVLEGHGAQVTRVAFHPSGRFAASTGYDHTTRLWDVERTQADSPTGCRFNDAQRRQPMAGRRRIASPHRAAQRAPCREHPREPRNHAHGGPPA
jgi:eukaryotic-like serine/threonine-protein kinase